MRARSRTALAGKVIDVHSHAGVSLKAYGSLEYPYAQTIEGLAYQQRSGGVDVNVVFPFTADLYFEFESVMRGDLVPAREPVSPTPYAVENRLLFTEVFERCPELSDRFLPFVSVDPGRAIEAQLRELERLADEFPIYGIKVNPVLCQSPIRDLGGRGAALLDFAEEHALPLLLHVNPWENDEYASAADARRVIERRPRLRFCLAHALLFVRSWLDWADAQPNVWVDTAAMKIQVELVRTSVECRVSNVECHTPGDAPSLDTRHSTLDTPVLDTDFADHRHVMLALCERYPETILWGTDSPAYAYICRRKQADGVFQDYRFKGTYEDELAALNCLPPDLRRRVSNLNTLDFLFGPTA